MLRQSQKVFVYFFISLIFHVVVLYLLPEINIFIKSEKENIIEVSIVKQVPKKVVAPSKKEEQFDKKGVFPSELLSQVLNEKEKKNLITPKVDLPTLETEERIDLNYAINENNDKPLDKSGIDIDEIIRESKIDEGRDIKQNSQVQAYEESFFQIEASSQRVRKPTFVPDVPDYSLSINTSVKIKFSIDSRGIPSNILFLTATDGYIERISSDFVLGLRFEPAGKFDEVDQATITLFYKVR